MIAFSGLGHFVKRLGLGLFLFLSIVLFILAPGLAQTVSFQCDDRANNWDNFVMACPAGGKAYAADPKWKDGVIVNLGGGIYTESNGFPQSIITHYWFDEAGNLLRNMKTVIDPGPNSPLAVRPGGTFQGVLHTQPDHIIPPGRYKILFRVTYHCGPPQSGYCNSNYRPVQLPRGFNAGQEFNLLYHSPWLLSQFAWAPLEILPSKNRPDPDTSGFKIICQPLGSQCFAGSGFYFETGGPNRNLRGGGCLKFYPKAGGNAVTASLNDEKGNPILGAKNYRLSGLGRMPAEGSWRAYFECYEGKPVYLGEFVLQQRPKSSPLTPSGPSALKTTLSLPQGTQTPGFTMPERGAVYAGSELITQLPGDVLYASSLEYGISSLSKGVSDNYCSLRIWRPGTRSIQMLGQDSQQWLEGRLYWAGKAAVPMPPIGVQARLPEDLPPGQYRLELICPKARTQAMNASVPLFAQSQDFEVKAKRRPRVVVSSPGSLSTGNKHVDSLQQCAPCNGDTYTITVTGLDPGDEITAAKWWSGIWTGVDARGSCRLDFPKIAFQCPVVGRSAKFTGKIPPNYDKDFLARHRLEITARDRNNYFYTIPGADISAEPEPKNWLPGTGWPRGDFNFYKPCSGFDNKTKPVITQIDREVDLTGTLTLGAVGFECLLDASGLAIRLKADNPPLDILLGGAGTDAAGGLQTRISLSGKIDPKSITAPVPATVRLTSYSGREVSARITLRPAFFLKVLPEKPWSGGTITVTWKGFQANAAARLYIDNVVLKENILLDGRDPNIGLRLPEGLTGKHRLMLVDGVGNSAEVVIEIIGQGVQNVCPTPCLLVQDKARQGQNIDLRISGFPRNADVTLWFAGFRLKTISQSSLVDGTTFIIPPGLKDGRYSLEARDIGQAMARKEIEISGNMIRPILFAVPVRETDLEVVYKPTIDSVHIKGTGWFLKGRFSATLIGVDQKRTYTLTGYRDGCLAYVDPQKAYGKPCDIDKGEIDLFWPLDATTADGLYMLSLFDGLTETMTRNTFKVVSTVKKPVPAEGPPKPAPEPAVPGKPIQTEEIQPAKGRPCDPNVPMYMQRGCLPVESPDKKPAAAPGKCNPAIPRYAQPGCID